MSDIAIKVENVSKKYQIGENKTYPTLRDKLMELPNRLFKGPKKTKEFWALKDVSFEIKKGEVVGIIGRNGAGKSTMLKILARITEPTSGKITMYGRVASMLEVGTGFNPELTGRENIYLNGAIIGMKKSEINTKFNDIVEFSGVGKFLDTPVKHYSSGMYVRLAFAVAAHLDADILLVDEVLAVGDAEFQKKCLGKMDDLAKSGRTVVLVSHNTQSITQLCTKTIYLLAGKSKLYGDTKQVMTQYIEDSQQKFNVIFSGPLTNYISFDSITINGIKNKHSLIKPYEKIIVSITGTASKTLEYIRISLSVYNKSYRIFTLHDTNDGTKLPKGKFKSTFIIPGNILRPESYDIAIGGHQVYSKEWIYAQNYASFGILPIWKNTTDEHNIGIINVTGVNKRE